MNASFISRAYGRSLLWNKICNNWIRFWVFVWWKVFIFIFRIGKIYTIILNLKFFIIQYTAFFFLQNIDIIPEWRWLYSQVWTGPWRMRGGCRVPPCWPRHWTSRPLAAGQSHLSPPPISSHPQPGWASLVRKLYLKPLKKNIWLFYS